MVAPPPDLGRRIAALPATYGLKVALVAVLTLYIAFLFDLDHTYWSLITVPLIVRPDGGTTVWRSLERLTGTLLGCAAGFVLAATFGQEPRTIIPALAIYLFIVGYLARRQSGLDAYGYAIAGFVALLIALDAGPHIDTAFPLAVTRATETAIPVIVAFAVMLVVFPVSVADEVRDSLGAAREATLAASAAVLGRSGDDLRYERTVLPRLALVNTALRALSFERNRRHHMRHRLNAVAAALNRVALRAEAVRISLRQNLPGCTGPVVAAGLQQLGDALERLPPPAGPAPAHLACAAQLTSIADSLAPTGLAAPPGVEDFAPRAMLWRLESLARSLSDLMEAEATLLDPSRPAPKTRPIVRRYADTLGAMQGALRPVFTFSVLSAIWLVSGWPDGLVLTILGSALSLVMPVIVPRALRVKAAISIGLGIVVGSIISLVLMVVLAQMEGFGAFALVFGGTFFAIFVNAYRLPNLPFAIGATIAICVGFQPQNAPVYDPLALFNTTTTLLLLPPTLVAALTIVFPENADWIKNHLARATDHLLRHKAIAAQLSRDVYAEEFFDVLSEFDFGPGEDREGQHLRQRARAALLAGDALLAIAEVEATGHLPRSLASLAQPLRTAVTSALHDGQGSSTVFTRIHQALPTALAEGEEAQRSAAMCFAASAELLGAIVAERWLSRRMADAS